MDYHIILDYTIGYCHCNAGYVREVLAKHKGKPVKVLISSYGGLLGAGLDIMQAFRDHGDVTAYISGFTASAATVAAMGAKKIVMGKYAFFLVHKCSNYIDAWGTYNADQLQQLIEQLIANKAENDKIDVVLAQLYADRCRKPIEDMKNILKEGRWLNAEEAKNLGFVDEVASFDEKVNLAGYGRRQFVNLGLPTAGLPEEEKQPSWFSALLDRIKAIVPSADTEKDNGDKSNHKQPMKKNLILICALLAVDALIANDDGSVNLTDEQLNSLEAHLKEQKEALSQKDNRITELEAQVENLKKLPGDETKESVVTTENEDFDYIKRSQDMYNEVKSML